MSTTSPSNQRRFSIKNLNPLAALTSQRTPDLPAAGNATIAPTEPDLITLADLQPQPIDWLWPQHLAARTLALLSGHPGAGKTWVALAIAAELSHGRAPYTGETLPPCTTLYVSNEHDAAQIILPRFAALHGDPSHLVVLRTPSQRAVQSPQTRVLDQLDAALERMKNSNPVRLVILDTFETLLGPALGRDSAHPESLDRLRHLAEHHHCCILLLRHLRRAGPGRPAQSNALGELSHALRTEFLAGATPDAPNHPALLHTRSNLAPLAPALSYSIAADGFRFTGISALTPQDLLAHRPTGAGLPLRKFAGNWLRLQLGDGSQKQVTLESNALRDGVSIATLRRARFDLGVISTKDGTSGSWFWTLPVTPSKHENK